MAKHTPTSCLGRRIPWIPGEETPKHKPAPRPDPRHIAGITRQTVAIAARSETGTLNTARAEGLALAPVREPWPRTGGARVIMH